jgi:glycosyltransferase involved in cell wall biosynthesis
MPWTVAVNGAFLRPDPTGVQRSSRELCEALAAARDPRFRFVVVALEPRRGAPAPPPLPLEMLADRSPLPAALWVQVRLPRLARRLGADLVWSPANAGPLRAHRHAVTIHDAAVFAGPGWFTPSFRLYYRALLPRLGRRAEVVFTPSEFARCELIRHRVAPAERIEVVPWGVGPAFRPGAAAERWASRRPYVLALGRGDRRKNIATLLRAWALLPERARSGRRLILAGAPGPRRARESRADLPAGVEAVGRVAEEDLPGLYGAAEAFVFPSLYEGFGLPPLEALACGTPVIASRAGSIPEVCAGAALYADPLDAAGLAGALDAVLSDPGLRARLGAAGPERAARFRWEDASRRTLAALARVLERGA